MTRQTIRIIIASSIFAFVTGLAIYLYLSIPKPPADDITYARICISQASKNKARLYSKRMYRQSVECYDSAMKLWKKENEKFILMRNYSKVAELSRKSANLANKAANNSKSSSKELVIGIKNKIDSLNSLISNTRDFFNRVPLNDELRNKISKGKLLFHESLVDFNNGDYLSAGKKINQSAGLLEFCYQSTYDQVKEYFRSQPYWKTLVENTIENTAKNNSKAIIVDKFARKLYVYDSGIKKYEFDAEFGHNWMRRKIVKNDKATPEGIYYITSKLPQNKTKYFRALLLNYPNEEDIERFNYEKKAGKLDPDSRIGGLIEIHGNGGKGIDWTDGCIALSDSDMIKVFNFIETGTPVVIVGSIAGFKTIAEVFSGIHFQSS